MEDLPPSKPAKVLRHFDARLATAVEALQQRGMLEALAASGGSSLQGDGQPGPDSRRAEADAHTGGRVSSVGDSHALSNGGSHEGAPDAEMAYRENGHLANGDSREDGRADGGGRQDAGGGDDVALGQRVVDFWLNLCLCHMLIVEGGEGASNGAQPVYQVGHLGSACFLSNFIKKASACDLRDYGASSLMLFQAQRQALVLETGCVCW